MKRICFLIDSIFTVGGVQRVTAVVAKALAADHQVTIVTFDKPEPEARSMYGLDETDIAIRYFSYPHVGWLHKKCCKVYSALYRQLRPQSRRASDLYGYSSFPHPLRAALVKELQSGDYETIIGVHAPLSARLATLQRQLPSVRCIGWIHNSFEALFGPSSLYIGPQLKHHYLHQLRKLDLVVVLCHFDAERYKEESAGGGNNITVIYNPLTLTPGRRSTGTSKRFLAVGRMSHLHKGFDLLIDAFHLFAQHNGEWRLDIVGEGPEQTLLQKKIADYGLQQRVAIHPFTNQIQDYYSEAQVYVLSSRWEGFGLVLVEAMAHGLPVVSSDLPTSREIMGDAALYFNVGDIRQLAQRLDEATKIDWPRKSEEALGIADRFNANSIIGQWKKII